MKEYYAVCFRNVLKTMIEKMKIEKKVFSELQNEIFTDKKYSDTIRYVYLI